MNKKDFDKLKLFANKLGISVRVINSTQKKREFEAVVFLTSSYIVIYKEERESWKSLCMTLGHEIGHVIDYWFEDKKKELDEARYIVFEKGRLNKRDLNLVLSREVKANHIRNNIFNILNLKLSEEDIMIDNMIEEWIWNYSNENKKHPSISLHKFQKKKIRSQILNISKKKLISS